MSDDIVYDELDDSSKAQHKKIKDKLTKALEEKQEYLDGWQRSKADYINLKKRSEEDKANLMNYAIEGFVVDMLKVADSFEMAFKDEVAWNAAPENWRVGIEFIYNQFKNTLSDHGITEINPIGEDFDPNSHASKEMVKVEDEKQDGKIVEVVQKGYKLKDKVIRFASVKVGEL